MNSTCPTCGITYRIDPAKIPGGGIRARCTKCDSVFRIAPAGETATTPAAPAQPTPPPVVEAAAPPPPRSPEPAAATPPPPAAEAPPQFGVADPHRQARRLARALVSDIVVYHPERRERSVAAGTLRQEFREEIRKSWDEYVSRVGEPLARQTPYFREALNEILAGGTAVF
jgi:predicted Zn finger-like uncharacterized protein